MLLSKNEALAQSGFPSSIAIIPSSNKSILTQILTKGSECGAKYDLPINSSIAHDGVIVGDDVVGSLLGILDGDSEILGIIVGV